MDTYAIYVNENVVRRYFVKANNIAEAEKLFDEGVCQFDPDYFDPVSIENIIDIEKMNE